MNPNDRDLDDLLGDGGGRFGNLYRRLPRYEPPRRLDRAVLGEASRAVRNGKPPRRQRWIVGIGSAAGLVLAAGIAWRIGHEPMATDAGADRVRVVPVQPITESPRARHDDEPSRETPATAPQSAGASPPPSPDAIGQRSDADTVRRARKPLPGKPAPRPVSTPQPKAASAASESAPPPAVAPEAFPQPLDAEAEAGKSENATRPAASAPAAKSARSGAAASDRLHRAAPPTPPSSSVELQRDMQLSPEDWLSRIRELVRQDRRQQAIESLRLFVRAHPDRPVPADLQPLLD
ncbi:MAG TPA: hypothetical protein VHE32_14795 [Rhodanobacteraceae bacterium]|nr:hypothetical protein [Rhodanobacteraceae bacterium]